ncbi:hypothetical protein Tco_1245994 [Tanacetum coccineum]
MDIEEDEDDDMDIEADEEDEDDEMDVEVDEEKEEEHPAPAYPVVVALLATAPSAEETEPITIPEPLPIPAWSDSEVARLLAIYFPHQASPLCSMVFITTPEFHFPLSPPSPCIDSTTILVHSIIDATTHLPTSLRHHSTTVLNPLTRHKRTDLRLTYHLSDGLGIALVPGTSRRELPAAVAGLEEIRLDPERETESISDLLETTRGVKEMRELMAADPHRQRHIIHTSLTVMQTLTKRDDSTQGLVHHTQASDSLQTGDGITGQNGTICHSYENCVRGSERKHAFLESALYQEFMKSKPIGISRHRGSRLSKTNGFERMDTVFRKEQTTRNENQIKFSTCTPFKHCSNMVEFHVMTVTHDVAYSTTWVDRKKKMTDKGHFKKECLRLKNNKGNRGNQAGNDRAPAKVYVVGNAGANPDNVVAEGGSCMPSLSKLKFGFLRSFQRSPTNEPATPEEDPVAGSEDFIAYCGRYKEVLWALFDAKKKEISLSSRL